MKLTIHPIHPSDARDVTLCGEAAFQNDLLNMAMFPSHLLGADQHDAYIEWRAERFRQQMGGPDKHWSKVVDDSNGQIAGYTGWFAPQDGTKEEDVIDEPVVSGFMDEEVLREMKEKVKATEERFMAGRKDFWYVRALCTHPDYQGKGVAKLLMQHGLNLAEGTDVYVESTPAALGFYKKFGFTPLDTIEMLEGHYVMTALLRTFSNTADSG